MNIPERWFAMRFGQYRGSGRVAFSAEYPKERLSVRVRRCLSRLGFDTVGDLAQYLVKYHGSMPVTRNLGQKSFDEIQMFLSGLHDSPGFLPFYPHGAFGPDPVSAITNAPNVGPARTLSAEDKAAAWDEVVLLVDRLRSEVSL